MEVGKNIIRRTFSLILAGVFERSPRRRNFQLKIGLIFSDISEEFHDLLQNRIGEVRILSEVRSYFHCGIDIKVRLTRRPGPFAWQFKFFLDRKDTFLEG